MIYSSSAIPALKKMNDLFFFLKRQVIWAVIGIVMMIIVSRIDYKNWDRLFLAVIRSNDSTFNLCIGYGQRGKWSKEVA